MILSYSFQDDKGKYYHPDEAKKDVNPPVHKDTGVPLKSQIEKMSKSKNNVVNPDDVIDQYGADALRLYEMFMGPLEAIKPWQTEGVDGVYRFLSRTWRLVIDENTGELSSKISKEPGSSEPALWKTLHKTIKKVSHDTEHLHMNTAIAQMMIFVNEATQAKTLPREVILTFLQVLAPYAPHLSEDLWERLGNEKLICLADWPQFDESLCQESEVTVVFMVNGKKRGEMSVAKGTSKDELEKIALQNEKVIQHLDGKTPKKVIVVPGKLVNLVV